MAIDWLNSGKDGPCPVCGRAHDEDCAWHADLLTVFCHTALNPSSTVPQPASLVGEYRANGQIDTTKYCDRAVYVKIREKNSVDNFKKDRSAELKQKPREYVYRDGDGNPCIKVTIKYVERNGKIGKDCPQSYWDGQKFVALPKKDNATPEQNALREKRQSEVRLYRIDDPIIARALNSNIQPIYFVEGEAKADALLAMGIAATTSIGGSGGWASYGKDYVKDIRGYDPKNFILVPDRDTVGVKYMEQIAIDLQGDFHGVPRWLYVKPESQVWRQLPQSGGFDIKDWLEELNAAGKDEGDIGNLLLDSREPKRALEQVGPPSDEPATRERKPGRPKVDTNIDGTEKPKKKTSAYMASIISGQMDGKFAYNPKLGLWFGYEGGVWKSMEGTTFQACAKALFQAEIKHLDWEAKDLMSTISLLKGDLNREDWAERADCLPFENGVLNFKTSEFMPHSPDFNYQWKLPRPYNPLESDWAKIRGWLYEAMDGDLDRVKVLLCWANAVLKRRWDLHKFMTLIGEGGSGKSTFMNLIVAMVGSESTFSSSAKLINENDFETAGLSGKCLLTLPDQGRYIGDNSIIKQLSGGDPIRMCVKNKQPTRDFFRGLGMASANKPVFDSAESGMERREIPVPFDKVCKADDRRDLMVEFEPELSAFTTYVLTIPDEVVSSILKNSWRVSAIAKRATEMKDQTSSIHSWMGDRLVSEPEAHERIGSSAKGNGRTLYGDYVDYCMDNGMKPQGSKTFAKSVTEVAKQATLGWTNVAKLRKTAGMFIAGVRFRGDGDENIPYPEEMAGRSPYKSVAMPRFDEFFGIVEPEQVAVVEPVIDAVDFDEPAITTVTAQPVESVAEGFQTVANNIAACQTWAEYCDVANTYKATLKESWLLVPESDRDRIAALAESTSNNQEQQNAAA
jgi:P4 family phage/plasmid primase-like protien